MFVSFAFVSWTMQHIHSVKHVRMLHLYLLTLLANTHTWMTFTLLKGINVAGGEGLWKASSHCEPSAIVYSSNRRFWDYDGLSEWRSEWVSFNGEWGVDNNLTQHTHRVQPQSEHVTVNREPIMREYLISPGSSEWADVLCVFAHALCRRSCSGSIRVCARSKHSTQSGRVNVCKLCDSDLVEDFLSEIRIKDFASYMGILFENHSLT